MKLAIHLLKHSTRTLAILLLVIVGCNALIRFAPGYLSDTREMDVRYADAARAELSAEAERTSSLLHMLFIEIDGFKRGDLGLSREYQIPVLDLVLPRLAVTCGLLLRAILLAWTLALCAALVSSAGRDRSLFWHAVATLLLAVPTAAMATICLLAGNGGPVLVMTLLLAARDFKFLDHMLRKTWRDPHLLQARAQGVRTCRLLLGHMLPSIASQLFALARLSIITALGALVPVEVIFNLPGVGQLAWNAALNRDLPVLLAVTMIMAIAVTLAGIVSNGPTGSKTI